MGILFVLWHRVAQVVRQRGKERESNIISTPHPSFVAALLVLNREDVLLSRRNSLKRCCSVVLHCNIMVKNANRPIKIYSALHSLSQDSRLQSNTRFAKLLVSHLSPDLGFLLANVMLSKMSGPTIHDSITSASKLKGVSSLRLQNLLLLPD